MTPTASSSGGYPRVPVPRHSPSFTSSATVYPLPGTGGRPRFGSDAHRLGIGRFEWENILEILGNFCLKKYSKNGKKMLLIFEKN